MYEQNRYFNLTLAPGVYTYIVEEKKLNKTYWMLYILIILKPTYCCFITDFHQRAQQRRLCDCFIGLMLRLKMYCTYYPSFWNIWCNFITVNCANFWICIIFIQTSFVTCCHNILFVCYFYVRMVAVLCRTKLYILFSQN